MYNNTLHQGKMSHQRLGGEGRHFVYSAPLPPSPFLGPLMMCHNKSIFNLLGQVAFASDFGDQTTAGSMDGTKSDTVPLGTKVFKAFQDKLCSFPFQVWHWYCNPRGNVEYVRWDGEEGCSKDINNCVQPLQNNFHAMIV